MLKVQQPGCTTGTQHKCWLALLNTRINSTNKQSRQDRNRHNDDRSGLANHQCPTPGSGIRVLTNGYVQPVAAERNKKEWPTGKAVQVIGASSNSGACWRNGSATVRTSPPEQQGNQGEWSAAHDVASTPSISPENLWTPVQGFGKPTKPSASDKVSTPKRRRPSTITEGGTQLSHQALPAGHHPPQGHQQRTSTVIRAAPFSPPLS